MYYLHLILKSSMACVFYPHVQEMRKLGVTSVECSGGPGKCDSKHQIWLPCPGAMEVIHKGCTAPEFSGQGLLESGRPILSKRGAHEPPNESLLRPGNTQVHKQRTRRAPRERRRLAQLGLGFGQGPQTPGSRPGARDSARRGKAPFTSSAAIHA